MAGADPLASLAEERVDHRFKGLPPDAAGCTVAELTAEHRNLFSGGFTTPVLALSAERLQHNLALMETYTQRHGLAFAPHGKTSMAPQLFHRQLAHGAWGITLAVPHQVRVARAFGIQRIFLANELVDPAALRWIARELDADPDFRLICYADSTEGPSTGSTRRSGGTSPPSASAVRARISSSSIVSSGGGPSSTVTTQSWQWSPRTTQVSQSILVAMEQKM